MKKKVLNGALAMALLVPATSAFVSCKDSDDVSELRSETNQQVASLQQKIDNLQSIINSMKSCNCDQSVISTLQSTVDIMQRQLNELNGKVAEKADATQVATDLANLKSQIEALLDNKADKQAITDLENILKGKADQATVDALAALITNLTENKADKTALVELESKLTELLAGKVDNATLTALQTKIYQDLAGYVTAAQHTADLQALKEALEAQIAAINTNGGVQVTLAQFTDLSNKVEELRIKINKVEEDLTNELNKKLNTEVFNTAISDINGKLAAINTELTGKVNKSDFEAAIKTLTSELTALRENVSALVEACTEVKKTLENHEGRIKNLEDRLTDLENKFNELLANLITGVNLEATYSPVLGYYKEAITGATSKVIGTYFGQNDESFKFPTSSTELITNGVAISSEEISGATRETIPVGLLFDESEGNAGKVFLNVDAYSSSFDASSSKAYLETTTGKTTSGVTLGNIAAATQDLGFGYTRSSNKTYEATATIAKGDLEALSLNGRMVIPDNFVENLKADIKNKQVKALALEVAQAAFDNLNGLDSSFPAYSLVIDNGTQTVSSKFEILTAAVNPLSFTFMQNSSYSNFPGLGQLESLIEKLVNTVKNKIGGSFGSTVEKVRVITKNADGTYTVELDGGGSVTFDPVTEGWTTTDIEVMDKLKENSNAINKIVDNLNKAINLVNDFSATTLTSYLDNLNSQLVGYLNSANTLLQPIMVFTEQSGGVTKYRRAIGASVGSPTSATSTTLIPTSPTMELLAPAYKRYIAVFDESGNQTYTSGVVDGSQREFENVPLSSGVNKIVYEAVDYSGKVVASKTYINVQ